MLGQPVALQPHYDDHLGDVDYWGPYVLEIAKREGLPRGHVEAPFVGTFPTFLIGEGVVKLFGPSYDGAASWAAEKAMCELLAGRPNIPAPELLASGDLITEEQEWTWPYLVTKRLRSGPVRERPLIGTAGKSIAQQLGEAVANLHSLVPPAEVDDRDLLPRLRSTAASRLAGFGLPTHLVEQVPDYLEDAPRPTTLVHADITADHLFHDGHGLTGIIDWGDAIVADPFYELVAIAFDCFDADQRLLESFLRGYGWDVDAHFAKDALRAICEFQFNAIARIRTIVDLNSVRTLDALADQLFGSIRI